MCLRCLLHHILSLIAHTFREESGICFPYYCVVCDECKYSDTFLLADRIRLFVQYTISISSLCKLIWRHWTYKMPVRYILSSVWVRGQRSNNKVTNSTGQILKGPLLRHNLSTSLAQQLKMQGKRLAILVISSYCRSTFGKEVQSSLKIAAILRMPQFSRQFQYEYKYIHYSMRRKMMFYTCNYLQDWLSSADVNLSLYVLI